MTTISRRSLVLAAAATALAGCATAAQPPAAAGEYATERLSNAGAFRVSYQPESAPVPIRKLHAWTLHVARPDGAPVADAQIEVDGDMPQHLHGLPTRPRMTRYLGDGKYLVEGIKFQMGGWWVMDFHITAGGRKDTVRFHLQLQK
jgi:hypothetical protein